MDISGASKQVNDSINLLESLNMFGLNFFLFFLNLKQKLFKYK